MQKYDFSFAPERLKKEVVYEGNTFTVTRITYENGEGRKIVAEGVARRSYVDPPDSEMGRTISTGRALKALQKKINHEIVRHNFMG